MKKRLLTLLLALVMVLGLCTTAFAAEGTDNFQQINTWTDGQFTDVPKDAWYAPTVQRAYELGLMKGTGDGTAFTPNGNISIAETLALACRLHSTYCDNGAKFEQGALWYQVYVDYAIANGIIAADDYSSYTALATRVDFVTILAASLPADALPAINTVDDGMIPDIPADAAYYEDAYLMYRAGILQGSNEKGSFNPDSNIMRSEVATIVVRMADPAERVAITLEDPNKPEEPAKVQDPYIGTWEVYAWCLYNYTMYTEVTNQQFIFTEDKVEYIVNGASSGTWDYTAREALPEENSDVVFTLTGPSGSDIWYFVNQEDGSLMIYDSALYIFYYCTPAAK